MAKVLEGPGMGLMKKWGIHVPNYVVVTSADELAKLGQANDWMKTSKLVAKAHEALSIGSYPSYVDGAFRNQIIVRGRDPQQVATTAQEIETMLANLRAGLKG